MFTVELYAKIRHAVMIDGLSRREAANCREDDGRHEAHAANPQDDRENMQSADNCNVIHCCLSKLSLKPTLFVAENKHALDIPSAT